MPELQRLRADHGPAVLAFELANRGYFAASVSDRGDEFFERFTERHSALLAEQEAGIGAFYVLVAEDGSVLGRFNLYDVKDGTAVLGYRIAQHVAGRGVATAAVRELCGLAAARYGLRTLKAATSRENAASQKVLARAGFTPAGPADPADLGGKQGTWYQRDLVQPLSSSLLARGAIGTPGSAIRMLRLAAFHVRRAGRLLLGADDLSFEILQRLGHELHEVLAVPQLNAQKLGHLGAVNGVDLLDKGGS